MSILAILNRKSRKVVRIEPNAPLGECIGLLNRERVGSAIVMDPSDRVLGIISERDILRLAYARQCQIEDIPVAEIMTPHDRLIKARIDESLQTVMERMTECRVRHIPIMEGEKLLGVVSIGDIVKTSLDFMREENQHLSDFICGKPAVNY